MCSVYTYLILFVVLTCPALSLRRGSVTYNKDKFGDGGYPMNTQATTECRQRYRLSGLRVRTCQSSEQWNGSSTYCRHGGNELNTHIIVIPIFIQ